MRPQVDVRRGRCVSGLGVLFRAGGNICVAAMFLLWAIFVLGNYLKVPHLAEHRCGASDITLHRCEEERCRAIIVCENTRDLCSTLY